MAERKLTEKQRLFAKEYLVDLNATQAAVRAGYSERTAYSIGQENLKKPEIQTELKRLMDERAARVELTSDEVLREIRCICRSDIRKIMHPNGRFKLPHELDAETAAAIASVKVKADGEIEYKFWDKNSSLEKAMRHLGQYEKDNRQISDPVTELLQQLGGRTMGVSADAEDENDA